MAADLHPDSLPETDARPDSAPANHDDDARSDIEQVVEARADAIDNGGGGDARPSAAAGDYDGHAGTGGVVKNQDIDAQ